MRFLERISEDEMIASFLKTEIYSPRFGQEIENILKRDGIEKRIIEEPQLHQKSENRTRMKILSEYRGYGKNKELFEDFPNNVIWEKIILNKDDLVRLKYIDYSYWIELSGGSRKVTDGVRNIRKGLEVYGLSNEGFLKLAEKIRNGIKLPEIIIVSERKVSDEYVILEGHVRVTAYLLAGEKSPETQYAILGYSSQMNKWMKI